MSKRILVTGATGTVGSELVRLLVTAGGDIRAATRSPEKAERLFRSEVDVVELDYRRASTFDAAVDGAEGIFLQAPPFDPDARETLVPLLDWAVQAGVGNVVMMTAMGVEVRDDLPIRRLEKHVESLGVAFTLLRPNFHMQHFAGGFLGERIRRTGAFSMPVGDARVSIVDGRDVAEVAAACLLSDEHDGKEFTLTGPEALTHQEIAETISGVIDARGVVRQHMAMGEQARIEGKVPPAGAPTLFARLGNWLALIWALALLGGSLVVNRRRRV